ncbi:hypothetical protein CJ030_MR8G019134 [Morella rubra]|uniref:Uncharacterized protein n=1 Tax=Morella rubra TaxID=262757 RepID=A0A6A1UPX3_9ROSI|nr:hypothetical protein CJ030_MR8G019134 [Morella rubra]
MCPSPFIISTTSGNSFSRSSRWLSKKENRSHAFLYADRSGEAGKKEGTRLGLSVVIAVSVHSCLLLKTLFPLHLKDRY